MEDVKELVERIVKNREAMDQLCRALLEDRQFARGLIHSLNEAIEDGMRLRRD